MVLRRALDMGKVFVVLGLGPEISQSMFRTRPGRHTHSTMAFHKKPQGAVVLMAFGSQWLPETRYPALSSAERILSSGGTEVRRKLAISGRVANSGVWIS